VDGCEILHQLIDGKHPIIYFVRVSTILLVMQDFATIHIVTTYLSPQIAIVKLRSAGPAPTKRSGRSAVAASPRQISWLIHIYIYYIYTVYIHIILVHNRLYDMIDILAIGQYENGISSCNFVQIELVHNDSIWFYWSNIMECATLTHAGQTMGVSGMFTSNIGVWWMYNGYIWDV